ncbi:protein anachronism isoform X1 [Anopheles stephensi]|uniref:TGFb_propeptide domain-containing protein n=1 Tax=Anopheles stephensi TaxID=30069 RepID=A0A182YCZ0_ANOST|nr:protein anachronism isoform X1 [Anopheles stephensi]
MKTAVPLGLLLPLLGLLLIQPAHSAPFNVRDPVEEGLAMPESKMIDFENLTESEREQFLRDNVNITAIKIQQRVLREKQNMNRTSGPLAITQSTIDRNVSDRVKTRKEYAEHIIGNIKHNIESNLMRNDTVSHLAATHEMAFSASCDMPKHTNTSQWAEDNTWNLYFRLPHNKQYNSVSSAVLRLYMNGINSTGTRSPRESDNCKNPSEQMIRITASVYFRKNRKDNTQERKKRMCSSTTITQSYRGWITMDTLLAVKLWDKPNRNFGIAIDVEDQEDRPLRAADFFQPADCSEASKSNASTVLPWSFFRNTLSWTANEMDNVPHQPRIDVLMHQRNLHHNHRPYRTKHHYGHNVRYHLANGSSTGSFSGNSYELDDTDTTGSAAATDTNHHTYQRVLHLHHLLHKLQTHRQHIAQQQVVQHPVAINRAQIKRRHLHHHTDTNDESEENQSVSASATLDSMASTSGEDRQL